MKNYNSSLIQSFWSKVNKTLSCWIWTAGLSAGRYGSFFDGRKYVKAHRFSYELNCGKIPKGMYICHHCDNPRCVNPDHLFLGTQTDNMRDMVNKGRTAKQFGEHNGNAKLSWKKVRKIRTLYATKKYIQDDLAKLFNVGRSAVGYILQGVTWKNEDWRKQLEEWEEKLKSV
jgi:hypothetical protein